MSIIDRLRAMLGDRKQGIKGGIDKAAKTAESKLGADKAKRVDSVADKAKDAVDKLAK